MSIRIPLLCVLLLAPLAGCGHDAADDHHDAAADHAGGTVHDGASATGDEGLVRISWATTSPLAPGGNVFHVTVTDAAGAALSGATVALELLPPDGGTPFSVSASAAISTGMFLSEAVTFPSGGLWKLKFHVARAADALHDHATFHLAVP
jgi:hypothetical protein